jgi:ferredoxin--NADP+ reductase
VSEDPPLRVAVVGSGPAGFYAAAALLASDDLPVEVDMIERLPTPWGLVRFGVAPDHPKIKSVSRAFEKIALQPGFRFLGNVEVGRDVTHDELMGLYDAVVYAVGAQTDRRLDIPGEDLPGSWAATEFVAWYNGHPDFQHLEFDLSHERAVVIGNGNVALDVARMLALTPEELIEFLTPRMPQFMIPRYVEFVDALPKTDGTFRVRKVELRDAAITEATWDRETAG